MSRKGSKTDQTLVKKFQGRKEKSGHGRALGVFSQLNSLESVQLLLPCLVEVFWLVEVSLFCFDRSVVTLHRRASVTPLSPPLDFVLSVFPPSLHELL